MSKLNLERAGQLLLEAHKLLGDYHELQEAIEIVYEDIDAEIDYQDEVAAHQKP
jgi:hypothetical protein